MKAKWSLIFIGILGFIFWSFSTVQSVSAACTGTIDCGHIQCDGGKKCSISGASCTDEGVACAPGSGTCTCYLPKCYDTGSGEGWKNCSSVGCSNPCGTGKCAVTGGCTNLPSCPYNSACGSATCDLCTEVCCDSTTCMPIEEGCGGGETLRVNCENLTINSVMGGSVTLYKDEVYPLSAYYYLAGRGGAHVMTVVEGLRVEHPPSCAHEFWYTDPLGYDPYADPPIKIGSGYSYFYWKPAKTGTYTVYCITSAHAYRSCSGYRWNYTTPCEEVNDACDQPGSSMTVYVVERPPPPPGGLSASCPSPGTSATLSWSSSPGATKYALRVNDTSNGWKGDCGVTQFPGDICDDNVTSTSYFLNPTTPGHSFNWWVHAVNSGGWSDPTYGPNFSCTSTPPSCTLSLSPVAWTLDIGQSATYSASVTNIRNGTVSSVSFIPGNSSIASVDPDSDPSPNPYQTQVTGGTTQGSTTITAKAIMNREERCVATSSAFVKHPNPWWQVVTGDVQTNGSLSVSIPAGYYFSLHTFPTPTPSPFPPPANRQYHFPGVVKYSGSTNLTSANVSERGWLANSSYVWQNGIVQNFAYFRGLISDDILPKIPSNSVDGSFFGSGGTFLYGYYWYEYDGSTTGSSLSITSPINLPDGRKVVIFVKRANLNIKGTINYTSGRSILVALVDGDINIDRNVGGATAPDFDLKGFFLANNIYTGQSTQTSFTPLRFKGSLAAIGSLVPQRDLYDFLNATESAQLFEYDPASAFLFPPRLSPERIKWKEVAP